MEKGKANAEEKPAFEKPGLVFRLVRAILRAFIFLYFRFRPSYRGKRGPYPKPLVVVMNHQSYLDPVLAGCAVPCKLRYLARTTLFRNRLFAALIRSLGAVPIDREGGGYAGLNTALKLLGRGEAVLLFPDGTRSRDGSIGKFKPGFVWLAQKAGAHVLPMVVSGAHEAWHRTAKFPRPRKIRLLVLEPIPPSKLKPREGEGRSEARARIAGEIRALMEEAKRSLEDGD